MRGPSPSFAYLNYCIDILTSSKHILKPIVSVHSQEYHSTLITLWKWSKQVIMICVISQQELLLKSSQLFWGRLAGLARSVIDNSFAYCNLISNNSLIASVSPVKGQSSRWRALPIRCARYPRGHGRLVPHLNRCSKVSWLKLPSSRNNGIQKITGYLPENNGLKQSLTGADVVVIPAGIPRKHLKI